MVAKAILGRDKPERVTIPQKPSTYRRRSASLRACSNSIPSDFIRGVIRDLFDGNILPARFVRYVKVASGC